MATSAALGKRRAEAIARIEHWCAVLAGEDNALTLPVFSHYGQETLLVIQLEMLADFLEATPPPSSPQPKPAARKRAAKGGR